MDWGMICCEAPDIMMMTDFFFFLCELILWKCGLEQTKSPVCCFQPAGKGKGPVNTWCKEASRVRLSRYQRKNDFHWPAFVYHTATLTITQHGNYHSISLQSCYWVFSYLSVVICHAFQICPPNWTISTCDLCCYVGNEGRAENITPLFHQCQDETPVQFLRRQFDSALTHTATESEWRWKAVDVLTSHVSQFTYDYNEVPAVLLLWKSPHIRTFPLMHTLCDPLLVLFLWPMKMRVKTSCSNESLQNPCPGKDCEILLNLDHLCLVLVLDGFRIHFSPTDQMIF